MIKGITAPTGGGKTYQAMRFILAWLVNRPKDQVVTNVALDVGALAAFCAREYPDVVDISERVRILTLDECGQFWLVYGVGYTLSGARQDIRAGDGRVSKELDYSARREAGHSVCYVLDEADELFDAKSHSSISHDLRFYCRHQRKFGDDVYLLTPAWEFLVKEMRVMCHSVWVMENTKQMKLGKIPLIGSYFRGLGWVKATEWKVRQGGVWGGLSEVARDESRFRVDPNGLGACYRTEDGLGVVGMQATVVRAEKQKGLSPVWLGVVVVAFGVVLLFLPKAFGSVFSSEVRSLSSGPVAAAFVPVPVPAKPAVLVDSRVTVKKTEEKRDRLVGIAWGKGGHRAILESGRLIWENTPGVEFLKRPDGRFSAVVENAVLYTFYE